VFDVWTQLVRRLSFTSPSPPRSEASAVRARPHEELPVLGSAVGAAAAVPAAGAGAAAGGTGPAAATAPSVDGGAAVAVVLDVGATVVVVVVVGFSSGGGGGGPSQMWAWLALWPVSALTGSTCPGETGLYVRCSSDALITTAMITLFGEGFGTV
jgi:hypothetical protein